MTIPPARIYCPDKTAMQSGRAKTNRWLLEFAPNSPYYIEPLMGWTGMRDTTRQLHLRFVTKEEAVAYAEKNAIPYTVFEPKKRVVKPKAYADNFKFDKKEAG